MTTGNFKRTANIEAWSRYPESDGEGQGLRIGFKEGAEWARAHLTAQEPTDAEVRAVKIALIQDEYRVVPGNELVMIRQMGREGEYEGRARAALSAARAARRDEETSDD